GQTFYYNGDEKSALKDYKSALAIDSKCGAAYFNTGRIMSGRKNYSGAIAQYSKAIACEPENIEYLGARGKLYDTNGDHNKAIADYTKVLQIRPSCIWAREQRAT
ncbi:MAG TPA: tetratricopeptide repeat protein, partial [Candidatus Melainabacteria bacterium]|nr:tetratricopeptide repeat protein [Candidatus Melainabacteria bacterium]